MLWNSQEKHVNSCHNYKSQIDINLKSCFKLRKMFPRIPSFRICPNAKYENSEISEIKLTLLFCSETVKKSMKTVTTIASNIKSSSCFDYQAFLNSEVSLIIRGAIKAKCASFLVINFACLLVSLEIRKKSLIGFHFLWKIPWLGVDLHEKFSRLVMKNFS